MAILRMMMCDEVYNGRSWIGLESWVLGLLDRMGMF